MKIAFTFIFLLFAFCTIAQRCGTAEYAALSAGSRNFSSSSSAKTEGNRDTLKDEVIIIPVVIHVLYNTADQNISDQQILSQLKSLNDDYRRLNSDAVNTPMPFSVVAADTRLSFCLAKVDPQGKATTGIIRKYTKQTSFLADDQMKFSSKGGDDAWDATKYLNLWVCNLVWTHTGLCRFTRKPC